MQIDVLAPAELTLEHVHAWRALLSSTPPWDNPFFQPGFVVEVAAVRPSVQIALMRQAGEIVGVFPFERGSWGRGRPVGAGLSEFQGCCVRTGISWHVGELLAACGLWAWYYDHVPVMQAEWSDGHTLVGDSPAADLQAGYLGYEEACRERGSRTLIEVRRKARKLARELGPLRFEWHSADPAALAALLAWKSSQHHRTGVLDVFRFSWVVQLLRRLQVCRQPGFRGVLSTLFTGDRLAAVHLGLASEQVLHWWYPAYDPALARYSPGLVLLRKLLQELPAHGIRRLDFGPGGQRFKTSLSNCRIPVALGVADRFSAVHRLRAGGLACRRWIARSHVERPARHVARWLAARRQQAAWR